MMRRRPTRDVFDTLLMITSAFIIILTILRLTPSATSQHVVYTDQANADATFSAMFGGAPL